MDFNYRNTTQLFFTKNLVEELDAFVKSNNFHKVLVITGGPATTRIAHEICCGLTVEHKIVAGVQSNPLAETVEEMTRQAKQFAPDLILTVGGGSVHDTGKAVAFMYHNDANNHVRDYSVTGKLGGTGIQNVLPLITVPTLFGSGAEVSPAALLRIGNQKHVIVSTLLHPLASFVNTDYTKSLSKTDLSRSAFDAFVQALEGFISTNSNNISNSFAKIALECYNACLPSLIAGVYTNDVLEKLAISSIFSSYVCSTSGVGAIHAISQPISGWFDVHHGTALAMIATDVLQKNLCATNRQKLDELDTVLSALSSDKHNAQERVLEKIATMIDKLGLLRGVSATKVSKEILVSMVNDSFNGDMVGNPYEFSKDEIRIVLGKWYEA